MIRPGAAVAPYDARTMDHDVLESIRALADPNRLRVAGACGGSPRTVAELSGDLDIPEPAIRRHLDRLVTAGLVEDAAGSFSLRVPALHALGRQMAALAPTEPTVPGAVRPDGTTIPPDEIKVIRGFLREDRLIAIPSQERKRLIIVRYLRDRCFTEDRPYPEKEVNQRLALFHPDVATLRRAMVDEGLMVREAGVYRLPPSAA
jgi:DNA-binding transcriptional ArsR family regulator